MGLRSACCSQAGHAGRQNQDAVLRDESQGLFAVADGMGGTESGGRAGQEAIGCLEAAARAGLPSGVEAKCAWLRDTVLAINAHLFALGQGRGTGFGATLTAAAATPAGWVVAHIGDSRAYRIGPDGAQPLTTDHRLVAEMVRDGLLEPAAAVDHPHRNVLTRALGLHENCRVEVNPVASEADALLLCSDGLVPGVEALALPTLVHPGCDLEAVATSLVQAAAAAGCTDDRTALLVQRVA